MRRSVVEAIIFLVLVATFASGAAGIITYANTTDLKTLLESTGLKASGATQPLRIKYWSEPVNALGSVSGATSINLSSGNIATATITGTTTWTFAQQDSAGFTKFTLIITNGGAFTENWPSGTLWPSGVAPTLTSAGTDVLVFFTVNNGTNWNGSVAILDER